MCVKEIKRKTSIVLAGLGALLCASGTSQAADWTVSLDYAGTKTGQKGNTSQSETKPWAFNPYESDTSQGAGWGNSVQAKEAHTATTQGSYILVLRWTPPSPTAVLPPVVKVRVDEFANSNGGYTSPTINEPNVTKVVGTFTLSAQVVAPDGTTDSKWFDSAGVFNSHFDITSQSSFIWRILTTDAQKQTNGSYLLRRTLPQIKAEASMVNGSYTWSDEDGSHTVGDQTHVDTHVDITPTIDTIHNLYISSNIETSYYKSTVAPTPVPTPPVAAGTPAPTPLPTPTPLPGSNPPVWRLPCQRNPDGSLNVQSVAQWVPHPDWAWLAQLNQDKSVANQNWFGGQGFWFGPSTLYANCTGFASYPFLTWHWSGGQWQGLTYQTRPDGFGGHVSGEPRYPLYSNYNSPLTFSNSYYLNMPLRYGSFGNVWDYQIEGLKLGDEDAVLPTTTFTVDAQDSQNGTATGPKLTSPNYAISWHRPQEAWRLKTQSAGQPDVLFDSVNFDVGTTLTRRYPKGDLEIQHPSITGKIATALGAGGATISLAYPPAAVAANILYFTSAALGVKAQFIDPADLASQNESQDVEISATYETLGKEIRASQGAAGATFPDAAPTFSGVQPQEWSYIVAAFNGPANQNPYWNAGADAQGSWTVHAHVERNVVDQTWLGDAYSANGYQGETTAYITKKGPPLTYREWTWKPAPTPHG